MKKTRQFRGWYMVGAVHLLLAVIFGAAYSFGAFLLHYRRILARGVFYRLNILVDGVNLLHRRRIFRCLERSYFGKDGNRHRYFTAFSGLLGSSLLASTLTAFLFTFCLLVGGGVGLVYVPAVSTIQRWFVVHRSSASGLALAGTGLGTLVGPMVAGGLMQHLSWQSTLQVYAVAIAVLGLSAAFVLRGRPEDVGEYPDGLGPAEVTSIPGSAFNGSVTLREAARQAQFWWFFIAIFFGSIGLFLALVHINPYAQQQGLNATQANLLIGLIGMGNIGGRLVLGRIGDRMGARRFWLSLR